VCLAIPGRIVNVEGEGLARSGKVDFAGVVKTVNLACVPEAGPGQYVIVHAGFAISMIDEAEAMSVFQYLREIEEAGTGPA
jgi:hydrogenase expression/formation protein HypC